MRSIRDRAAVALGACLFSSLGAFGCSAETLEDGPAVLNTCSSSADCGANGACATLPQGNLCVAKSADLQGLVIEIRTDPTQSGAIVSRVFDDGVDLLGQAPSGFVVSQSFDLDALVTLSGAVIDDSVEPPSCVGPDGSVPAKIELRQDGPFSSQSDAKTASTIVDAEGRHRFSLSVPPGPYDLYVRPLACEDGAPPRPPLVDYDLEIEGGGELTIAIPPTQTIAGELNVPDGTDVTGWTVELVEPRYGFVISEPALLDPSEVRDQKIALEGEIGQSEGIAYTFTKGAIVRLRDSDGNLTVHWELDKLLLAGDEIGLSIADLMAEPRVYEGTVVDEDGLPVPANITIQSDLLTGGATQNASYKIRTETDPDGRFEVKLVPGEYRLFTVPVADESKAIAEETWSLDVDDLCCGRTITLKQRPRLRGTVGAADGALLELAPVVASPSIGLSGTYASKAFNVEQIEPRESTSTTDSGGQFELLIDAGEFDLSVRPPSQSGLPWFVRTNTQILPTPLSSSLGSLSVPYPAVLTGRVATATGPAAGAVVRAWLPVSKDAMDGSMSAGQDAYVQVGEAIADGAGDYALLLPPTTAAAVEQP